MTAVQQVGGTHYRAMYQHWDWCDETGMPYLEACATKYLARWRDKGGLLDLQKAMSYLQKALVSPSHSFPGLRPLRNFYRLERFLTSANVPAREAWIIREIDAWMAGDGPIQSLHQLIEEVRDGRY